MGVFVSVDSVDRRERESDTDTADTVSPNILLCYITSYPHQSYTDQ